MIDIRQRYLRNPVEADLKSRMVFIGGPRQVGKTTFALGFLASPNIKQAAYLNWDDVQARSSLMKGELPANQTVIILDEIHKYARWRNLVKGFYDTRKGETAFLVTDSAKLDHYRRGVDSLHGRYHYYRLHPFSLRELNPNPSESDTALLLKFGGGLNRFSEVKRNFGGDGRKSGCIV